MNNDRDVSKFNWSEEADFEQYDIVRYFINKNKTFPNNTIIIGNTTKGMISFDILYSKLKKKENCKLLHRSENYNIGVKRVFFDCDDVVYMLEGIYKKSKSEFKDIDRYNKEIDNKESKLSEDIKIVGSLTLLHKDEILNDDHKKTINDSCLKTKIIPTIGMISKDIHGFYLNHIPFETPELSMELDLHYGENFEIFHDTLIKNLCSKNKGLTIFYGPPGGGKSSYIKTLINVLSEKTTKEIVFLPSSLTSYLLEPEFNDFLLTLADDTHIDIDINEDYPEKSEIKTGKGVILIVEEAQNILRKRDMYDSGQSISNILNLTDGVMNDVYGVQVIATHNSKDSDLDPALLRNGRLLAKREFKELPLKQAKKLAKFIGVEKEIKNDMIVADIYSLLNEDENNILIETRNKKKMSLGENKQNKKL